MCPSKLLRATACAVLFAFLPGCSALFVQEVDLRAPRYADEADEDVPDCT
jgi:hypothetical protein